MHIYVYIYITLEHLKVSLICMFHVIYVYVYITVRRVEHRYRECFWVGGCWLREIHGVREVLDGMIVVVWMCDIWVAHYIFVKMRYTVVSNFESEFWPRLSFLDLFSFWIHHNSCEIFFHHSFKYLLTCWTWSTCIF